MTKLKPHEIFMAGVISGCPSSSPSEHIAWITRNNCTIKNDFFDCTGIQWPDDVSVVDCWNKVMAEWCLRICSSCETPLFKP